MNIQLFLTPLPLNHTELEHKTVVVVDVLRSSTSICASLLAGARGVIPMEGPGEAGEMYTKLGAENAVLAGERNGVKIENFQYGNSPTEFTPETVGGKTVILCTTNGTGIFARTKKAELTISGGLVNASAVAGVLAREAEDVLIVCGGREGGFSIEDTICAGKLIDQLRSSLGLFLNLNDAASLSHLLYDNNRNSLREVIAQGEHGRFLASIGLGGDVDICARVDSMPVLPVLREGRLVKEE
jgi:2-phosphosulfolactate phosphatase